MARKPRIHYPGAFYHVMLRGNAKQNIFFSDDDRNRFCLFLRKAIVQYHCQIHAFCLMHNHVHLIIQVSDIPLSKLMQNVSFRYAQWINKRMGRIGHLFQGRFKAILVDTDSYLITLVRYIHLNPVRANLISDVHIAWWSSHCSYLGALIYPWVTTEFVLSQLSFSKNKAIKIYQEIMCSEMADQDNATLKNGITEQQILGDQIFAKKITQATHIEVLPKISISRQEIIDLVCAYLNITTEELHRKSSTHASSEARALIAWLCRELTISTLTETALFFHRTVSTITEKIKWMIVEKPTVLFGFLHGLENRKTEA